MALLSKQCSTIHVTFLYSKTGQGGGSGIIPGCYRQGSYTSEGDGRPTRIGRQDLVAVSIYHHPKRNLDGTHEGLHATSSTSTASASPCKTQMMRSRINRMFPAGSDHFYSIEISENPDTHSSTGDETKSDGGHRRDAPGVPVRRRAAGAVRRAVRRRVHPRRDLRLLRRLVQGHRHRCRRGRAQPNCFDPRYLLYGNAWGDLFKGAFLWAKEGKDYRESAVSLLYHAAGLASHSPRDYVNAIRLGSNAAKEA
jgi:hypothetical protein